MQQPPRTADYSSEPLYPAGKLSFGGQSRADRPQIRPWEAGEDSTQLPPTFNHSSFSPSRGQRATDWGARGRVTKEAQGLSC